MKLGWLGLLVALFASFTPPPVLASESSSAEDGRAERERLEAELRNLAERQRWPGVERLYRRLHDLPGRGISYQTHRFAADAARNEGRILQTLDRLLLATAIQSNAEDDELIAEIRTLFGEVEIVASGLDNWPSEGLELTRDGIMPFQPDQRLQIEQAKSAVAEEGRFRGMLPVGYYEVGGRRFRVTSGVIVRVEISTLAERQRRLTLDYRR